VLSSRYALLIGILLATGLALDGFMAWQDRDLVRKGYPDFTIFYSAGKMVRAGQASSLYDERAEFRTQQEFAPDVGIRHGALPYNHPPFEALLFVPFSLLPYFPAYLAWNAVNLLLMGLALAMLRRPVPIVQTGPLWLWMLGAIAYFPIFVCFLQGQDMLLFFFLLVLAFGCLKGGTDFWAGCWLGVGVFRPHLILPLAIILLFSRRRNAVLGIACSAAVASAASIVVVGWREFFDYPKYVWKLEQMMGRGAIVPHDMPNLRGLAAIFFQDGHFAALSLIAAGSVLLIVLAIWLFRRSERTGHLELGFSAAVLVTILVSYHAFMYDLALLFLPVLLLFDKARPKLRNEILRAPWESMASVAVLWCTPLLMLLLLRLGHLNFLTPVLLLWLWGMARSVLQDGSGREPRAGAAVQA
jgi:Glycosyltransferase family 87